MTVGEKMALAEPAVAEHGLGAVLSALDLARSTWYYQRKRPSYAARHAALKRPLETIARKHPEYGYRRATAELRARLKRPVNHKLIRKLHQQWDLPLIRRAPAPKPSPLRQIITTAGPRVNLVARLEVIGPFEVLYTDFTELVYAGGRKRAQLMVLLDHASKLVPGWAVDDKATIRLALAAWGRAKKTLHRLDRSWQGIIVHQDQDPVFTSGAWVRQLLVVDRARVSYALRGARDNPEMESFHARFKVENRSLFLDAESLAELESVVRARLRYYNQVRRHSSLGMISPLECIRSLAPHPEG
jgi:transposase InsO family protein